MTRATIVIPTLGRYELLGRVLDRLSRQTAQPGSFDLIVAADANERRLDVLEGAVGGLPYTARLVHATRPGASGARNAGWRAATAPLVLFLDDDILPEPPLVQEHLEWHERHPEEEIGVLGLVRWADELRVTPFMRWLEDGIQFDYPNIQGIEAGWGRFYTANASVKRTLVERVGGFEEERLPFGYEDLDIALRMHKHGFRLLYNRAAVAEHVHPMNIEFWKRRVSRIAISERQFMEMHPGFEPYFYEMFSKAGAQPPARGRGAKLARVVPRSFPWIGPRVWGSADTVFRQTLAGPFLRAWEEAAPGPAEGGGDPNDL